MTLRKYLENKPMTVHRHDLALKGMFPPIAMLSLLLAFLGVFPGAMLPLRVAHAAAPPMDPERATKAEAVLRVRFLSSTGGDKDCWDSVRILTVIKNTSGHALVKPDDTPFSVAHSSGNQGLSRGVCTVYLERYYRARTDL